MDYSVNTQPLLQDDEDSSGECWSEDSRGPPPLEEPCILKTKEPSDRYMAGYLTFYLLGILTLLPWNFFVTASDYWMYKLRDTDRNNSIHNKTDLQTEFTPYVSIAATGPSLFFLLLNSIFSQRVSMQARMFVSMVIILISFLLTTALVEVDTDSWQQIFFVVTISTVVIVNIFGAILQAGLWAIVSRFSTKYISAVVGGQALAGIFAALVYIASLVIGASSTHCALVYFNIANVTIICCLISYTLLSRSIFFKFHMLSKSPANTLQYDPGEVDELDAQDVPSASVRISQVLPKMWPYGLSVFMCYTVTQSVYPAVTVLVVSVEGPSSWHDKYFVPVVAFLVFSIWDYLGRILAGYLKWPLKRHWIVVGFSIFRIVFIPLIMLCNAQPRHYLPVLVPSDPAYIVITCFFAFTNGYLTNITIINIARIVDHVEKDLASFLMAAFLGSGCAVGAFFSFIMTKIL